MLDLSEYQNNPTDPQIILKIATDLCNKGLHELSLLFAKKCIELDISKELYISALNIIGISGYYSKDPNMIKLGKQACESLSLDKNIDFYLRETARRNSTFYLKTISELMPSTQTFNINFKPKNQYNIMNPSLATNNGSIWMIQRSVNYIIREDGSYDMQGDDAIKTINFLIELDPELSLKSIKEIKLPENLPTEYKDVLGFEDSRLFFCNGEAWCTSTVRQLVSDGLCEIVIAKISDFDKEECYISDYKIIRPQFIQRQNEKNWMPIVISNSIFFLYSNDPVRVCDINGNLMSEDHISISADSFRGGGNLVEFDDGWLAIVHESNLMHDWKRRYVHRFVFFNKDLKMKKITESFCFQHIGIEFAPGLTIHPTNGKIIIGYGVHDKNSFLSIVDPEDIKKMLKPI